MLKYQKTLSVVITYIDYYNWDEPLNKTLRRENFDRMAKLASKNDAVIIQGIGESHFYSDLFSWKSINGMEPEDVLPAIMITTLHPKYFLERNERICKGEPIPENEIVLIKLRDICKTPLDAINLIKKIFQDIKNKRKLKDLKIAKGIKKGVRGALVDALILEPNFSGLEVD